jgi:dTDP-D-glucose 4,6-dehydratase
MKILVTGGAGFIGQTKKSESSCRVLQDGYPKFSFGANLSEGTTIGRGAPSGSD